MTTIWRCLPPTLFYKRYSSGNLATRAARVKMLTQQIATMLLGAGLTGALDNVTQRHVSESLDSLNCTRVVVAHRLSTVRHCDRILVVDGRRIAEEGTYDELVAKGGLFTELVERQRLDA